MVHAPLVSCSTLAEHLDDPKWVVFDCRHALLDPDAGPKEYAKGHIPGAFHAHIDRDLAGPVGNGGKGRHPLPIPGAFQRFLRTHGVDDDSQVVCYDDAGGAWAARLWWLLRHHGHTAVAVLDGGIARWKIQGRPLSKEHRKAGDGAFSGTAGAMPIVQADDLDGRVLIDARAPERFRGEQEPIDPVPGHIPGARNLPHTGNLNTDGRFLSPDELKARYEGLDAAQTVVYCGSGVTAAHDVLAMEIAGLGTPALYPGSWSEWSRAGRPVATGD